VATLLKLDAADPVDRVGRKEARRERATGGKVRFSCFS